MKKPKGFFTYFHLRSVIEKLSNEQAGLLYKSLLRYGELGEVADFSDDLACDMAFTLMRGEIDVNFERYREVCEIRSQAAKKREDHKRAELLAEDEMGEECKHGIY